MSENLVYNTFDEYLKDNYTHNLVVTQGLYDDKYYTIYFKKNNIVKTNKYFSLKHSIYTIWDKKYKGLLC